MSAQAKMTNPPVRDFAAGERLRARLREISVRTLLDNKPSKKASAPSPVEIALRHEVARLTAEVELLRSQLKVT